MNGRLYMNFGPLEQNIAAQNKNADHKVTHAADFKAAIARVEQSWRSDDFRDTYQAAIQQESRTADNARHQYTLAKRHETSLEDGIATAKRSSVEVKRLFDSA
jgi:hypothetical protein